ncbi:hypothetical protein QFC19_007791 [Naganishia cerealis]|uniref:Uncharacterized protein n=1 Tax=Naganishia cerealis TaxID=610337 RepID=A0ACC2V8F3_9TREE|nr:hypothetical protein QFC19_007791 [Naganishia cerealis]
MAPNLFMPKKRAVRTPTAPSAAATATVGGPAGPTLKALGRQRSSPRPDAFATPLGTDPHAQSNASSPSAAVAATANIDFRDRSYQEFDIISLGTPSGIDTGPGSTGEADFNVMRLYQLNSSLPLPPLDAATLSSSHITLSRKNPQERPAHEVLAAQAEREARRVAREQLRKPVQNGPNGEWRIPVIDREGVHQVDQRTGERMWRIVQDPSLVAPELRKDKPADEAGAPPKYKPKPGRGRGGGGRGRGRGDHHAGAKVFARSGNFKDGVEQSRGHQELNREKLPLVLEGIFPPPASTQKWVGKHQAVDAEAWAALLFESRGAERFIKLKVVDREYKFEPHRVINVPQTSWEAGKLLFDHMEGKNTMSRFAFREPGIDQSTSGSGGSSLNPQSSTISIADVNGDVKPTIRPNPDAFPRMLAPSRGRTLDRSSGGGSLKVKLERGAYEAADGIERADDEELDYNEDVADDEEAVALGVDDEVLERETKARLQEEFFRANATAGNLQREQTPESDDEVDEGVKARREAELKRERKMRRRLRREKKARGDAASDDDDDDDDEDEDDEDDEEDSLFGSDDDDTVAGEQDVKPDIDAIKSTISNPAVSTDLQKPTQKSPARSRAGSPSGRRGGGGGSGRSVSPLTSAGAGHHLVASRALSPQGKSRHASSSSRKRKNEESQTAPPEAGRSSSGPASGAGGAGALHSFKKSRPNTDAGERRATVKDAEHVPIAINVDEDDDVKPGTPVPGHPTGLPKHKARGKKKRPEDAGSMQAGSAAVLAAVSRSAAPARQTSPAPPSASRAASPAASAPQPMSRDASPSAAAAPVVYHPTRGPLTQEEYQTAIVDAYADKITETEFKDLLRGKEKMSVKDIRNHFGKRMKKNQRGILTAKFFSWKLCNGVDGGFTLKKEFQ